MPTHTKKPKYQKYQKEVITLDVKTSITINPKIWKEIKKSAIDQDKTSGEFIAWLYQKWKENQKQC